MEEKDEEVTAYKVVGPEDYGTNLTGAIWDCDCGGWSRTSVDNFVAQHPDYFPKYTIGETIKAPKGTLGILCFEDYRSALKFKRSHECLYNGKILRVKGKRGKYIKRLIQGCMDVTKLFYLDAYTASAPFGTIGFDEITVIKEAWSEESD